MRNRHKLRWLFESFDKSGNDPRILIVNEVIKILLDRYARLVATGNDMAETDVTIEHQRVGNSRAQAAALRNERDRTSKKPLGNRRSKERCFAEYVQHSVAVGTTDQKVTFLRERFESCLSLLAFYTDLGEACREDYPGADAALCSSF